MDQIRDIEIYAIFDKCIMITNLYLYVNNYINIMYSNPCILYTYILYSV